MSVPNTCPPHPTDFFSDGRDFQLVRSCVCWGGKGKHKRITCGIHSDPQGKSVNQGF